MITVDARGLFCPAPVVEARKAIARLPEHGGQVHVFVDNQLAAENLSRMAAGLGFGYALQEQGDGVYSLTITVGEGHAPSPAAPALPQDGAGLVVSIGRDKMGGGSDELGEILIKGFLYALVQLPQAPRALLFFNGGIQLALENSNSLSDIRELAEKGTRVLVCGTCVNYYEAADKLAVGEIANMFDLLGEMADAERLIQL